MAINAVKQALFHPLLEDISLTNASGVIVNFTSGGDLTLMDIGQALGYLQDQIPPDAELVFGTTHQPRFEGQVQTNLIVTGLGADTFDDIFGDFARNPGRPVENKSEVEIPVFSTMPEPAPVGDSLVENTKKAEDPMDV